MYELLVILHSWLRWVVLLAGVAAFARSLGGASAGRGWTAGDESLSKLFGVVLNVQFAIGLVLYVWLSPLTASAFADFGAAMARSDLRFWAVEHVTGMVVALALVHIGRARVRKAAEDRRHRTAAIFLGLALLVMLISIPWPGTPAQRPLFRGF